ncbi:MAG: hypothetical protein L6R42_004788 [Xanthoria sp. 1 TBL-2021]|nr:MAG: hypothetical protein L6R42_004788 [Xanthoria sp. 1 TBL-2021]
MNPVYEPVSKSDKSEKSEAFISYRPVRQTSSNLASHVTPPAPAPRRARRSRLLLHWVFHILSLLWIAPIATLLWLNFSKHVIGASAWCPRGNCNAEGNSENAIERAKQLDRQDHNVTGALQFVAKALEVWFFFVATSLVYDMGIMFAKRGRGLPVGYILTHLEFGDIRYVLNPLLWTAPLPRRQGVPEKRARIIKLYLFACITAMLTILANLMGPSTAVLVLPTLQWVDTPHVMHETFNHTAAGQRPSGVDLFPGCSARKLRNGKYSCTADTYGPSLDEWAAHNTASYKQLAEQSDGTLILGASQEAALTFTINSTATSDTVWVPSRQVLRDMSHEFQKLRGVYMDSDEPEYPGRQFNNSLQTILQRQGPSLGFYAGAYRGNVSDYGLTNGPWVRCFTGWTIDPLDWDTDTDVEYTKCFRLGQGPKDRDTYAQFDLGNFNATNEKNSAQSGVGVFVADRAAFYNEKEDFGSGLIDCLITNNPDGSGKGCDWDKVFATTWPEDLRNATINVGVTSYSVPGENYTNARVWCEHVIYQSFPTYSVDTSPRSNIQNLVKINNLPEIPKDTIPLKMNPAWLLTAWSVDYDGELDGERQIVKELSRVLPVTYEGGLGTLEGLEFVLLHFYALGQALSMVNHYGYAPPTDPNSQSAKQADKDQAHPIFRTYATIHVWAYGLSGRTSRLGVAVVALGIACVLARFLIGLSTGIQERSTVEVLAAAFEHRHQGEFDGLEEENHLAKVRYQVVEDGEGKQRFIPEKRTSRWSNALSH